LLGGGVFAGIAPKEACVPEPEPEAPGRRAHADDLVAACQSGSLPAFETLYQEHGPRMKSVALNVMGNVADAEDAVQEAFLKIFRNVGAFRGQAALSTWIYRILLNACYDLMRKKKRRHEETSLEAESAADWRPSAVPDHPLRLALEKSLSRLDARSRSIFVLFEVEGFKHREIAEIMKIPEGTSKNLLFEAKRELHRLLSPESRRRIEVS
jgi:RNA polymerase sigma-70 factor, ECF subfamily